MVKQVRVNKTYLYQGRVVTVLHKKKNPHMPETLIVKHTDASVQEIFAKPFRKYATV